MPGVKNWGAPWVRRFLQKNPNATEGEIAEHSGHNIEEVRRVLKKGDIHLANEQAGPEAQDGPTLPPNSRRRIIRMVPPDRGTPYRPVPPTELPMTEELWKSLDDEYRAREWRLSPEERALGP